MIKALFAVLAILLLAPTDAVAHHKPGHNPPGHQKQKQKWNQKQVQKQNARKAELPYVILLLEDESEVEFEVDVRPPRQRWSALPEGGGTAAREWSFYEDPDYGFSIEIPTGIMEELPGATRGLRLQEIGGSGLLDVYGGANSAGLDPQEIAAELEHSPDIAEVTYRASGRDWVALSGYYTRADYEGDDLIFYAKFMFNDDRSLLSAFEISYPERERAKFDPIVEQLEETLSPPR